VASPLGSVSTSSVRRRKRHDDFDGERPSRHRLSDMNKTASFGFFHNQGDGIFIETTEAAGLTGILGG